MPFLIDYEPVLKQFESAINTAPTMKEFSNMVSLAVKDTDRNKISTEEFINGFGNTCIASLPNNHCFHIYNDRCPSINDYINTSDHTTAVDYPITTTSTSILSADDISGGCVTIPSSIYTETIIGVTKERTIEEIVQEKLEEYKEVMKLQALGCKNCGGSINKETVTCEYCGTNYRN